MIPAPRGLPTASTTPVSSRPSSPKLAAGSSHHAKITQALQSIYHRNKEHVTIQLRREVVETRVKERENVRRASQHKYAEFPSLRETHRRSEKKDQEDLAVLRKEEEGAHARSVESSEHLASLILQVYSDLQQEKDKRAVTTTSTSSLVDRLDNLEKQHQEDVKELKKGLAFETAQRKALDIENKSLKAKLSKLEEEVEKKHTSTSSALTEQADSIKRLIQAQLKTTSAPTPNAAAQDKQASDINQCIDDIVKLRDILGRHDKHLGELDTEIITEACSGFVTRLPRLEKECDNLKVQQQAAQTLRDSEQDKLAADLKSLRSRLEKLESDAKQHDEQLQTLQLSSAQHATCTTTLESSWEQLQADIAQLKVDSVVHLSRTAILESAPKELAEQVDAMQQQLSQQRAEAQKPILQPQQTLPDAQQFTASVNEIKSSMDALQKQVDKLGSTIGDTFVKKATHEKINKNFLTMVGGWIDEIRKRLIVLETGNASNDGCPRDSTRTRQGSEKVEAAVPSPRQTADPVIKKLSDQVDMNEKSLKAVRGTIDSIIETEKIHMERIQDLEEQRAKADKRMDGFEQGLGNVQSKMEKRMEVVDQQYLSLDSQMNNLTTEGLYSAIISHLDKEQPGEAQLGQKVQTIIKQMSEHEHRLIKVEKSSRLSEEPARKRQKLSPNGHELAYLTNGNY
ncbi:hypothetical protein GCG54_00002250 [Colletotrichum gloeosporioides]|uniref:Uncharacterized protein n=1 Tax=Colletotrichum gloeosporioides TaxID=474922 RepID=A0A8H4FEN3_COLGL|nr:uncharacterized protein GCG54_00002250 [Colletotrichum gloeosporioides]KAF3799548.1 hypothetical protein GCG54_00002250 [Colletotrichum gloeosporioides]